MYPRRKVDTYLQKFVHETIFLKSNYVIFVKLLDIVF